MDLGKKVSGYAKSLHLRKLVLPADHCESCCLSKESGAAKVTIRSTNAGTYS